MTDDDLKRSIDILEETEMKMHNVFNRMGQSSQAENIQKVMNFVARRKEVSMAQLMQEFLMFVSEIEMDQILGALRASNFIYAPISRGSEVYIKFKKADFGNSVQFPNEG